MARFKKIHTQKADIDVKRQQDHQNKEESVDGEKKCK